MTLNSIRDGFFACDADWRFVYVNASAERILGICHEEVLGKSHWEVFPLTLGTNLESEYRRAAVGEIRDFENFYEPWGRWFHNRCYPREGGGMSVYFEDITKRKRNEQQLFYTSQRLESLLRALPVGISFSSDSTCQIITGNPVLLAQFEGNIKDNISASALDDVALGRQVRFFLDGRQISNVELPLQLAVAENRPIPPMELEVLLPSGKRWFAEASGAPILDPEGNVVGGVAITMDITERKKAEAKLKETLDNLEKIVKERTEELEIAFNLLKESENKYRSLFDNMTEGFTLYKVILDFEGNLKDLCYVEINKASEKIIGLPRGRIVGKMRKHLFPQTNPIYMESITKTISTGQSQISEWYSLVTNTWFETNSYVPNPGYIAIIFRDITERKKAEENIQALANAVESSNDAIITESLDGIIESWNMGAKKIYGYSAEEILGKDVSLLEPDDLKEEIKQLIEKTKQEEEIQHYETLRLKKDGIVINVSITLSPIFDSSGKFVAISCIGRDITEGKEAEEKLRESEEKYRNIVETANEGILIIDDEALVTYANKKLTDMLGYSLEEGIGKPIWSFVSEESKDVVKMNLEKSLRGINDSYELKLIKKDGSSLWTHLSYKAFFNKDDKFVGSLSMLTDITERKKAEEMLKLKLEELARSNEELEQFAYVSSHDLQEPLRMITSYLQLLQRKYQGNLDDKADKYIHFAVDGASRMQNLISDLLEYSLVSRNTREVENVDCEVILNQCIIRYESGY